MKLNLTKEVWIARIIAWLVLGAISFGIIFMTNFMVGPVLFINQFVTNKIALAVYCPGAESSSLEKGASTQTTSVPQVRIDTLWK